MRHFTTPEFWACYDELPTKIQELADRNYKLLKHDARHPSLHFKQVNGYLSVRVGKKYRAIGIENEEGVIWFWIGTHTEHDKLIS